VSEGRTELERWRAAFTARRRVAADGRSCPPAEALWDAAGGRLAPRRNEELLDHVGRCAACSIGWDLARELAPEPPARAARPRRRDASRLLPWAAAAALLVAAATGWGLLRSRQPDLPVVRDDPAAAVRPLVGEDAALPREDFVLRWTEVAGASSYELRVTTGELDPLLHAHDLAEPVHRVDPRLLERVPPGATLYWQVVSRTPGGERRHSPTFVVRVE
jgi:hypothetical protein